MASVAIERPFNLSYVQADAENNWSPSTSNDEGAQRQSRQRPSSSDPEHRKRYLEVSPYLERDHLLDLDSVDLQCQLFALALLELRALDENYASTRYEDAMNWSHVMFSLRRLCKENDIKWEARDFYVVEFRSVLKEDIDRQLLFQLDKESHREASLSGGLLKYWFGSPDHEQKNLATCLWRAKEDAVRGGKGPWHKRARGIIGSMYASINVKGLRLHVDDNATQWRFEPFT